MKQLWNSSVVLEEFCQASEKNFDIKMSSAVTGLELFCFFFLIFFKYGNVNNIEKGLE